MMTLSPHDTFFDSSIWYEDKIPEFRIPNSAVRSGSWDIFKEESIRHPLLTGIWLPDTV